MTTGLLIAAYLVVGSATAYGYYRFVADCDRFSAMAAYFLWPLFWVIWILGIVPSLILDKAHNDYLRDAKKREEATK